MADGKVSQSAPVLHLDRAEFNHLVLELERIWSRASRLLAAAGQVAERADRELGLRALARAYGMDRLMEELAGICRTEGDLESDYKAASRWHAWAARLDWCVALSHEAPGGEEREKGGVR